MPLILYINLYTKYAVSYTKYLLIHVFIYVTYKFHPIIPSIFLGTPPLTSQTYTRTLPTRLKGQSWPTSTKPNMYK